MIKTLTEVWPAIFGELQGSSEGLRYKYPDSRKKTKETSV